MSGFLATPEWERFTGVPQGSSEDWAEAHEGMMDAMNRALAKDNFTSLNIHPNGREADFISI